MSLFAIFGSGFGLYGYLPALVASGQQIVLPERYRNRFQARSELASFAKHIEWEADEDAVLKRAMNVVFALQPSQQYNELSRCLTHPHIERLLLEKPLAESPQNAAILLDKLIQSGKTFRIAYTFRYTHWAKQLITTLKTNYKLSEISIQWRFMAHHFHHHKQTWKRSHTAGGGVIRFYGIHIIALLAEIGYRQVLLSQTRGLISDEIESWRATFMGEGLPKCEVVIDSRSSVSQFQITQNSCSITDLLDPFDSGNPACQSEALDQRVPILSQLCHSLWEPNTQEYDWYAATIQLWLAIENETQICIEDAPNEKEIN